MRPEVELRLPGDSAFISVLRATTVSLAARLDFTIDDIEDLRMAVGEASSLLLPLADEDADLTCQFFVSPRRLQVTVTVPSDAQNGPDMDGFAWQMLSALTTDTRASTADGAVTVSMTMSSSADE